MSHRFLTPLFIPNRLMLGGIHLLSLLTGHVPGRVRRQHKRTNDGLRRATRGFIENQDALGAFAFGSHRRSSLAYFGCGILAVYNALLALSRDMPCAGDDAGQPADRVAAYAPAMACTLPSLPALIAAFERRGNVLGGGFGISPYAIARYLRRRFPDTRLLASADPAKINALGQSYRCFITTIYNHAEDIYAGLHTVCITREDAGYVAHNTYRKNAHGQWIAAPPQPTLADAVYAITPHARPIAVIGIRRA